MDDAAKKAIKAQNTNQLIFPGCSMEKNLKIRVNTKGLR